MTALDAGIQQVAHLALGGAAVEEDQLQPALLRQEAGQAAGVGRGRLALGRLQQQPVAVGVAAEVEEGDAVAVARVLEHVQDVAGRGVLAQHQLAVTAPLGGGQRPLHLPRLFRQVAQVARPVVAVVGEGEEEDGFADDGHWFAPVLIRPRGLYIRHKGLRINAVATELAAVSQPAVQLIQLGLGDVQVTVHVPNFRPGCAIAVQRHRME